MARGKYGGLGESESIIGKLITWVSALPEKWLYASKFQFDRKDFLNYN